jgi:hypothetical protein
MLNKIAVKISGGIGNQLFQLAFGLSLGDKFNVPVEIDDSSFINYSYHHDPEIQKLELGLTRYNANKEQENGGIFVLKEGTINSLADIKNLPDTCRVLIIDGYWQSENYSNHAVIAKIYFKLVQKYEVQSKDFIKSFDSFSNGLAIHIRRRDYSHMGVASEEYYLAAYQYFREYYGVNNVALFSDEPNYSFHFLKNGGVQNLYRVSSGDDWLDLYLMSKFKNIIIGNSTYSWWGAYFGENTVAKKIVCPEPWVLVDLNVRPCPDRWLKVQGAVEPKIIDINKITRHFFWLQNK